MSAVNLTERITYETIALIQANIATALSEVRAERVDPSVNTELPKSYFPYAPSHAFQCPAVSVIADNIDFHLERGQNFLDATVAALCSVCVEDKTQKDLQKKAWRYQDALFQILNRAQIEGPEFKFIIKVTRARYSSDNTMKADPTSQSVFQKEVVLDLEIESYQND